MDIIVNPTWCRDLQWLMEGTPTTSKGCDGKDPVSWFDLSDFNLTFCLHIGPQRSVQHSFYII